MKIKTIVLEGPAGAGKGTVAWYLATRLDYLYIDTGAIYRSLTFHALETKTDILDQDKICQCVSNVKITYRTNSEISKNKNTIFINDIDITDQIRTQSVSMATSVLAGYPCVVEKVKEIVHELIENNEVVAEGQTIAEYLIPNPDLLIFLTAKDEIRAQRRYEELKAKHPEITYQEVLDSMRKRDHNDQNREFNKMKIRKNAVVVDTSELSIYEAVEKIYQMVKEA